MACYRSGGCGPYEMRSCSECPASKPEYMRRQICPDATSAPPLKKGETVKIKVFLNEKGVRCAMCDKDMDMELEIVDETNIPENDVDAYVNQLCGDGFMFIDENSIKIEDSL